MIYIRIPFSVIHNYISLINKISAITVRRILKENNLDCVARVTQLKQLKVMEAMQKKTILIHENQLQSIINMQDYKIRLIGLDTYMLNHSISHIRTS